MRVIRHPSLRGQGEIADTSHFPLDHPEFRRIGNLIGKTMILPCKSKIHIYHPCKYFNLGAFKWENLTKWT